MSRYDSAILQRLSFRRQFILGPHDVSRFPSWQSIALDAGLHLTAHPDIDVARVTKRDKSIVLLGYILDPANPAAGNVEIATELLEQLRTCDDVLEPAGRLGGRWVLVVNDGVRTILFADAAGLRQVVHTASSASEPLWCASQPGLLAELVRLPMDEEAAAFLRTLDTAHTNRVPWFPGSATPYAGIRLLLPNHYLDLGTGQPVRYWPTAPLPAIPLRAAIATSAEMLCGLMESARHRFALMVALTAGWDSRLMLAATRPIARDTFYYTAVFGTKTERDPDVTTPARLLSRLGLKHEIFDCRDRVDDEFARIYRRNVVPAYEPYGPVAQALLDRTPGEGICVTGDAGEVAKCEYRLDPSRGGDVTAHDLAVLSGLPPHPFVLDAFEHWLSGARAQARIVPLLDLYAWEQLAGRLQAMMLAECDIARESFAPLNCRSLLTTMLSVSERYRQEPTFDLFRALIARLWPDALSEPINGQPQLGAEVTLRRILRAAGLLSLVPKPIKRMAKGLLRRHGSGAMM
jgi:hypothetical protein